MEDYKMALINAVIAQIKVDIADGNYDAIAEMLDYLPNNVLEAYLPEIENIDIELDDISHINE
jgi:hypothetical protein